jgi:hypothetical protein
MLARSINAEGPQQSPAHSLMVLRRNASDCVMSKIFLGKGEAPEQGRYQIVR